MEDEKEKEKKLEGPKLDDVGYVGYKKPQEDNEETDIQIVHITLGPREFIGEMDIFKLWKTRLSPHSPFRLQNAAMVLYKDVSEGKVQTLLLNLQEKLRYTGEVIVYPGEANSVLIMPLDNKGQLYKDYKSLFSTIIQPKATNIIPGPGAKSPFPYGN